MYIYQVRAIFELGDPYFDETNLFMKVVMTLPSMYLSGRIIYNLYGKYITKSDTPNAYSALKFISWFYMSLIVVMVFIFLFIFIQKFGHPSFYSVTAWYIYFYGVLNYYPCILLSAVYIVFE